MTVGRQMKTDAQREFWREVERSAKEVDDWPAWLRGVREDENVGCGARGVEDGCSGNASDQREPDSDER